VKVGDLITFGGQGFEVGLGEAVGSAPPPPERAAAARPGQENPRGGGLIFVGVALAAAMFGLVAWWVVSSSG
jgi:hypothetical protein